MKTIRNVTHDLLPMVRDLHDQLELLRTVKNASDHVKLVKAMKDNVFLVEKYLVALDVEAQEHGVERV